MSAFQLFYIEDFMKLIYQIFLSIFCVMYGSCQAACAELKQQKQREEKSKQNIEKDFLAEVLPVPELQSLVRLYYIEPLLYFAGVYTFRDVDKAEAAKLGVRLFLAKVESPEVYFENEKTLQARKTLSSEAFEVHHTDWFEARIGQDGQIITYDSRSPLNTVARIWDCSGKLQGDLEKHTDAISEVEIGYDGTVVTISQNNAFIWNQNGTVRSDISKYKGAYNIKIGLNGSIVLSPDDAAAYHILDAYGNCRKIINRGRCRKVIGIDEVIIIEFAHHVSIYDNRGALRFSIPMRGRNHGDLLARCFNRDRFLDWDSNGGRLWELDHARMLELSKFSFEKLECFQKLLSQMQESRWNDQQGPPLVLTAEQIAIVKLLPSGIQKNIGQFFNNPSFALHNITENQFYEAYKLKRRLENSPAALEAEAKNNVVLGILLAILLHGDHDDYRLVRIKDEFENRFRRDEMMEEARSVVESLMKAEKARSAVGELMKNEEQKKVMAASHQPEKKVDGRCCIL